MKGFYMPQKLAPHTVRINLPDYTPSKRQIKFHTSIAFETLYGGAAGGGKTAALCAEAITAAIEQEDTHVYVFRRTLKELKQSVYNEVMSQIAGYQNLPSSRKATMYNGRKLTITYNGADSKFNFSNGSFIQLAYLDSVADRYNYMSAEIHVLLIDELTHFLEDDYEYLKTRVRSKEERRLRIMACTNPGNVGHGWVKNRFIKSKDPKVLYEPEVPYYDKKTGNSRVFIPAKVTDHPSAQFKRSYLKVLNAIADEQLRKALRDGDWDVFEGQVYTEWNRDLHIIRDLPTWYDNEGNKNDVLSVSKKYVGFDWGYNDYACAIWLAVPPEGINGMKHIYVYREIYERQKAPTWWAEQIASITKDEPIEYLILPHDCFSHLGGNQTIARTFSDYGLTHLRADSMSHAAKLHRQALLHQLLATSKDDKPYLMFHTNVANTIRTLPDLPYSDTKPEEISEKSEDHAFDALTYGLMVVTDGESWIYNPELQGMRAKQSFIVSEEGKSDFTYDLSKAIQMSELDATRDWRYV
jgi:hypothetical protein